MKHSHLKQIIAFMQPLQKINAIYRVSNSVIKIVFDKEEALYFDMKRGSSSIFTCKEIQRSKVFQAPFDVILAKKFNRSTIHSITMHNHDKIMRIATSLSGAYKESSTVLQLEFTGKYTNAIILDEENVVLEALRHIDENVSSRSVRVGEFLKEAPPPAYEAQDFPIDDVKSFLEEIFLKEESQKLSALKKQKTALLSKRMQKLQKHLKALESEEALQETAQQYRHIGHLVVANLHHIKPYVTQVRLNDYEGRVIELNLEKPFSSANLMKEHYFKMAKKTMQRASNLHIERENLQSKITYTRHFIDTVENACTIEAIMMLFPEQTKKNRENRNDSVEVFFIEGHKVLLGKNERGNIEVLQNARARDIWLHLKERPSAHVIIVTDKQNLPESVIQSAAELCVNFSVFEKGSYLVDYTQRREVKIQEGANVLYYNYSTISINKG
jgi:predicted ribosome quality control (RQC) complex YloA/Tae2 family protein